jgi:hypothetical protein
MVFTTQASQIPCGPSDLHDPVTSHESFERTYRARFASMDSGHAMDFRAMMVAAPDQDTDPEEFPMAETSYLPPPPFQLNDSNRHHVMVYSEKSCEGPQPAIDVARDLKHQVPEFDYAVFLPYPGNECWHAIMVATWVSYATAREALKKYQEKVPGTDALIWSCSPAHPCGIGDL